MSRLAKSIFGFIFFGGLVLGLGTAGASDLESIGLDETAIRVIVSVVMMTIGFVGLDVRG